MDIYDLYVTKLYPLLSPVRSLKNLLQEWGFQMKFKRFICLFVSAVMMMSIIPTSSFATETNDSDTSQVYTFTCASATSDSSTETNDELFESYLEQLLGLDSNSGIMLLATYSGEDALSGLDLDIYTQLKAGVAKIASGEETSSVVSFDLTYTYEEFGADNWYDAVNACYTQINSDLSSIYNWLIADCAYELYWHNKVENSGGIRFSLSFDYGAADDTFTVSMECSFAVATDYQGSSSTTVDSTKVATAVAAAEYAQSIVDKYASYSDEEKLEAYKEEICALASYEYNYDSYDYGDVWQLVYVFDQDTSTKVACEGYSKAFQYLCDLSGLYCITVSGTMTGGTGAGSHMWNVVYLDGVNYLVDVTNSDSGTVGQNGGLFMVCDPTSTTSTGYTFTVGSSEITYTYGSSTLSMYDYDDYLKLGSTSADVHTHNYGDPVFTWSDDYSTATATFTCKDNSTHVETVDCTVTSEVTTEATCTSTGVKTYTATVTFEGTEYTNTKTEAIAMIDHDYVSVVTAPTCTEDGYTTYTCSVCGDSYTSDEVEATGHTAAEAVVENNVTPTCTEDGSYESVVYCSVCGEEISRETITVPATGHTAAEAVVENNVAATCTTDGSYDSAVYCSVCGEEISRETVTVPATGHTAAEAVTENEVAATCTADGSYDSVVYCSVCGEEISRETITVPATGHTAAEAVTENEVAATCTEDGSYESVVYCSVCGEEISRETITVPATGHDYSDPVFDWSDDYSTATATFTCDSCGDVQVEDCTVTSAVTDATCEEDGATVYTATVSFEGTEYTDVKKVVTSAATGHDYGEPVWAWDGYDSATATFTCGNDNTHVEVETATITSVTTAATCTEDGKTVYTATVVFEGTTYTDESTEVLSATGHIEGEATKENEVAATCTTGGSYESVVYCATCGAELSRETVTVEALGHDWDDGVVTKAATCTEAGVMNYTCTRCGDSYTEEIPATGHTEAEAVVENEVAATCTTDGSYDSVVYCSVCGEELSRDTITVPATGHTAAEAVVENEVAATCTTDGSYDSVVYCSVCGEEISRETITVPATGHTEAEAVVENEVAATCTTDGSYDSVVYCSVCGEEISRETITVPATGHTAAEVVVENEVAATCTTDGSYDSVVYCSVCGEEISRETITVPATGHTAAEAVVENEVAATCTTDGSYDSVVYCSVCGEEISRETITVPAAHTWDEGVVTTAATCTTDGLMTYTCTVCGEELTEVIPATGHTAGTAVRENVVEATSTTEGSYDLVTYCTVCGEELSRETVIVPAKGVDIITVWLRTPANYTAVNDAIAKANALNPDDYTNFSIVTDAIDAVNWNYNALSQSYVTEMANAIETAIANLIPISATVEDIEISEPIESTDTEDEGDDDGALLEWTETSESSESNPTTGAMLTLIPMAIAALAAVSSKRR